MLFSNFFSTEISIYWLLVICLGAILRFIFSKQLEWAWAFFNGNLGWSKSYKLTGIWESRYFYTSSSRGRGAHPSTCYIIFKQYGNKLVGNSSKVHKGSQLLISGKIDRNGFFSGYWKEITHKKYVYHGTLQLIVEPQGHFMSGKWIGFSSSKKIKTGKWEFIQKTHSTKKSNRKLYQTEENNPLIKD